MSKAFCILVVSFVLFSNGPMLAFAEPVPDDPKDAEVIVEALVKKVFVRQTQEENQYVVELQIEKVERGKRLKTGEFLLVYCFQRKANAPKVPSASGHNAVPKEGQRIRAMMKSRKGVLEGVYADWFEVRKPKKIVD